MDQGQREPPMIERRRITVSGVVQGVGFRPFIYGLAAQHQLTGQVINCAAGVAIEVQGDHAALEAFLADLQETPPPLSVIAELAVETLSTVEETAFTIRESDATQTAATFISPDYAICPACLHELFTPGDPRYRYPFINCTCCGPRYTIIQEMPYDRERTAMAGFSMCARCRAEYDDPADRRFHAEATCCPECGPTLWLEQQGASIDDPEAALAACIRILRDGGIVAIKGIGGYHLACDARSATAVQTLRDRKGRYEKPFAVMVDTLESAYTLVEITPPGAAMLQSNAMPIVVLPKKEQHGLADAVAPKSAHFGLMLPYTPLHHLLLQEISPLVMTSGNASEEPIAFENEDAVKRLGGIADAFLLHDRPIYTRADDSVLRFHGEAPCFLRRSRGFAPFPVKLPFDTRSGEVLATGSDLKNTVCVTRNGQAFLSQHIGDLANAAAYDSFLQATRHLESVLEISPDTIACDLHPGFLSSAWAKESGRKIIPIQHHYAHIAAVMAEHGRTDPVIGLSFDGTGWGTDDTIWGGEILRCDLAGFERLGHLDPVPLPGGDAAARRPETMAYAYLYELEGVDTEQLARERLPGITGTEQAMLTHMLQQGMNSPMTTSMGRLFDAASALLGICRINTFEGQAAMELEAAAVSSACMQTWDVHARLDPQGGIRIPSREIIRALMKECVTGTAVATCAKRFHATLVQTACEAAVLARNATGIDTVALSGGVFVNELLQTGCTAALRAAEFEVLLHRQTPPGDGGISLGQAAITGWRLSCA